MDRHVKVMQSGQDVLEAGRSVVDLEREIDAELEKVRAEAARAKAELQEAEAKAAHYDKCYREYMESGDDYGERERVFRKRALEGDADAAAYLAEREEYLWERSGLSRDAYRKRRRILDRDDWEPIFFRIRLVINLH